MVTVATFITLSLLVGARSAEASCEICKLVADDVEVCQQVRDEPGWRNGRTDCVENSIACPPRELLLPHDEAGKRVLVQLSRGLPGPSAVRPEGRAEQGHLGRAW